MKKLFLVLLILIFAPSLRASVIKQAQDCVNLQNFNSTSASCVLQNTTAGNKIVVAGMAFGGTFSFTCTEACTAPSGALSPVHGSARVVEAYADTTSSHSVFSVSYTCSGCNTGISGHTALVILEMIGLSTGNDAATAAGAASVGFTTAFSNELAVAVNFDLSGSLVPGNSFNQLTQNTLLSGTSCGGTQKYRIMVSSLVTGAAGSYTASFTNSSSGSAQGIAVISFQTSGGTAPAVNVVQSCDGQLIAGNNLVQGECILSNVTAGNTIIGCLYGNGVDATDAGSTEALTIPSSAGTGGSGMAYVKLASSHTTFDLQMGTGGGNAIGYIKGIEVSGLASLDTSSAAAATSTNFTSAAANEIAIMCTRDVSNANTQVLGNSFAPVSYSLDNSNPVIGFFGSRVLGAAGSYTASYTQTGSTSPITMVLVFAAAAPSFTGYPAVY